MVPVNLFVQDTPYDMVTGQRPKDTITIILISIIGYAFLISNRHHARPQKYLALQYDHRLNLYPTHNKH